MNLATMCPDVNALQTFVDGRMADDEQAVLAAHLETCQICQREIENVAARSGIWRLARSHLRVDETPSAELQRVVASLESGYGRETQSGLDTSEIPLTFLEPTEKPGCLGRIAHYDVHEMISRGGMGIVLKAFDEKLQRSVAIKVLAPRLAVDPAARQRFLHEARAAAAIRDPHVIDVHAVDESNGLPYIVMGFVGGGSLQDRLDRDGPPSLPQSVRIGMEVALGLAAAHAQGLVHRDVKPANILIEEKTGNVRLTDFGLVRALADPSGSSSNVIAGTPAYMAPEQARGGPVDHRSDLFSLGSVLFALCTGKPPFPGCDTTAILQDVEQARPLSVRDVNAQVPEWLAAIIAKLHDSDPAWRYTSAAEVAEVLRRHLASLDKPALGLLSRRRRPALVAAALVFAMFTALGYLYGPAVYRLVTDQGQLVIETDDADVEVIVKQKEQQVTIIDTKSKQNVTLKAGKYQIELAGAPAGLKLSTSEFTLERGGNEIARVRLEPTVSTEWRRLDHDGANAVVFSADSTRVFSGGWDQTARLWEVASGKELHRFEFKEEGKNNAIYCVAIAPIGTRALAGSRDGRVWYLDLENGKVLQSCDVPKTPTDNPDGYGATCLAISPDGRHALIGSYDGSVRVWDLKQWKELTRFQHPAGLWTVDYSPDGRQALTGSGRDPEARLVLWELKTLNVLGRRDYEKPGGCGRAVFSPDGRFAASGNDKTMRRWRLDTWEEARTFPHPLGVTGVCFTPDGNRLVSGCEDGIIRLWDAKSGRELHRFVGSDKTAWSIAVSPDGRFVAATSVSEGHGVRLWKLPK